MTTQVSFSGFDERFARVSVAIVGQYRHKGRAFLKTDDQRDGVQDTPTKAVEIATLSLVEAGHLANQYPADSTFARYRERKAPNTISRHPADLEQFTIYLH